MKILTLTLAILSMLAVSSGATPVLAASSTLPAGTWTKIYDDEFHAASSLTSYNTCYRWACAGGWNGELERYAPASVTVSNGKLELQATQCSMKAHNISYHYCSGMVTTADKFSFLYGYAEARVLLPAGQGLWPAFWMLAQNGQSTTELDVMEVLGNAPSTINVGSHWLANGKHLHQGAAVKASDLSTSYHVVAVDWESDHMTFFEDGKALWTTTNATAIPSTAMYLLFNLAVGGNWPGSPNTSTPFPSNFLVDWVHVYQHPIVQVAHAHASVVKTYVVCLPTPNHPNGGYYYNVRANARRGILTTLRAIALSYRLPLDAIAAVNPLVTVDQQLALNTSVCIAYV